LYMCPHVSGTEPMGFSKQDACRNLVVDSLLMIFPFPPFAEGFWCKCPLGKCESYLSYSQKSLSSTFARDIGPAKLHSTARVRNTQGSRLSYDSFWAIPKHSLHLITSQWVPCTLLKAIVQAFLATKSFAVGSLKLMLMTSCQSGVSRLRHFKCSLPDSSGALSSPFLVLLLHVAALQKRDVGAIILTRWVS
jgi:hypothetical protein